MNNTVNEKDKGFGICRPCLFLLNTFLPNEASHHLTVHFNSGTINNVNSYMYI